MKYYFKVRRNACTRKVRWRSRPFPFVFLFSFSRICTFLFFLIFSRFISSVIFHGKVIFQRNACNKPRARYLCLLNKFKTVLHCNLFFSIILIIFSDLSLYVFFSFSFPSVLDAFFFLSYAPRAICTVKNSESSLKRARKKWHETPCCSFVRWQFSA